MPSTPPPKTARELVALVESLLPGMSAEQRRRFWVLITEHQGNTHYKEMLDTVFGGMKEATLKALRVSAIVVPQVDKLTEKLKKYRPPKRNVERDADIMRLHREGKRPKDIFNSLRSRYTSLTPGKVRAVISRCSDSDPEAHKS